MTVVGGGGIRFHKAAYTKKFKKEYRKLEPQLQERVDGKIRDLFNYPIPAGLSFEKLQRHSDPDIYTIHVDGNYKISLQVDSYVEFEKSGGRKLEIKRNSALLRRVGTHNEIDRAP